LAVSDGGLAVLAVLVSRIAAFAVGYYDTAAWRVGGAAVHWTFVGRLTREWAVRDGGWFIGIARNGYSYPNSSAFFPLYPLLLRLTAVLTGGNYQLAGVLLSLACYAGAMLLLYRLTAAEFDTRTAALAVVFISVFPTAFIFGAVYSESLFLLLSLAAFVFARRGRLLAASVAGMSAVLTRSSGLLLLVPLFVFYAQQRGWTWRHVQLSWRSDRRLGWLALLPAGLLAYMAYLWSRLGNPLAFNVAERVNWGRTLAWPSVDVIRGFKVFVTAIRTLYQQRGHLGPYLLPDLGGHSFALLHLFPFAAFIFALVCIVFVWRRLPPAYTAFAVVSVLMPLAFPARLHALYSFHRFTLVIFPLFMALAAVMRRRPRLAWVLAACSFVLMLWLCRAFARDIPSV
jgi:hypothetical protein